MEDIRINPSHRLDPARKTSWKNAEKMSRKDRLVSLGIAPFVLNFGDVHPPNVILLLNVGY
jgi:hypothetical protein